MSKENNEQIKQSSKKNGVNLENKAYSIIEFKVRNFGDKVPYKQNMKALNNIGGYEQDNSQKSVI